MTCQICLDNLQGFDEDFNAFWVTKINDTFAEVRTIQVTRHVHPIVRFEFLF